jgi:hypothetical protein
LQKSYQTTTYQATLKFTPQQSASDLAAAINAIVIESGLDDATRPGLMAAMDVASGSRFMFGKSVPVDCIEGRVYEGRRAA